MEDNRTVTQRVKDCGVFQIRDVKLNFAVEDGQSSVDEIAISGTIIIQSHKYLGMQFG